MSSLSLLRLGVLVSLQNFIILTIGYFWDQDSLVGGCAVVMGIITIIGLLQYPTRTRGNK